MAKVTADDRKFASQFMTLIMRNAYGGNMLTAEHSLAKLLADERERCAKKLDEWANRAGTDSAEGALLDAADKLRGVDSPQMELEEEKNV